MLSRHPRDAATPTRPHIPLQMNITIWLFCPAMQRRHSDPDSADFFAHQMVNNICATLAALNALGNCPLPSTATPNFTQFVSFAGPLDAASPGYVVTNADWLLAAHTTLSTPGNDQARWTRAGS
ncbi:hypothetical protein FIBSPDRAFT_961470 [Athelia psychrophila]|uniref:ubiquitinyl hydrolase 1 n=1 Tax=Athelia psychrophila TaxID=1759441 RepID=A0A166B942_9AGAM|nr:hypothetical protein FIBSPDRAFT_961470 [Fibularhizoctonia sp. CBS 109695]